MSSAYNLGRKPKDATQVKLEKLAHRVEQLEEQVDYLIRRISGQPPKDRIKIKI